MCLCCTPFLFSAHNTCVDFFCGFMTFQASADIKNELAVLEHRLHAAQHRTTNALPTAHGRNAHPAKAKQTTGQNEHAVLSITGYVSTADVAKFSEFLESATGGKVKRDERLMIVGLHACGDLTATILRAAVCTCTKSLHSQMVPVWFFGPFLIQLLWLLWSCDLCC